MNDPILLVEDNNADAALIERAFQKAKIANPIRRLGDGDAAVDYLSGKPPYEDRIFNRMPVLALLDVKLPRRSGFEVLSWLRSQQNGLQRLPVVILTSSGQASDINRAYDLGANSYLVKPGNPSLLLEIIQHLDSYWLTLNQKPDLGQLHD